MDIIVDDAEYILLILYSRAKTRSSGLLYLKARGLDNDYVEGWERREGHEGERKTMENVRSSEK